MMRPTRGAGALMLPAFLEPATAVAKKRPIIGTVVPKERWPTLGLGVNVGFSVKPFLKALVS
jgi:hypothetical protein